MTSDDWAAAAVCSLPTAIIHLPPTMLGGLTMELPTTSALLPVALVIAVELAARSSLRSWIAVRALDGPAAPTTDDEAAADARKARRNKVLGLAALGLLLVAEVTVISTGSPSTVSGFFTALTAFILVTSFFSLSSYLFSLPWVAYRKADGGQCGERAQIHSDQY